MEGETKKEVEMQETKIEVGNKDQQVSGKEVDNTPNPDGQKIKRKMLLTPAWDYVMMFADVDVPKEKDQPVPESSGKYKKWTKVREERTAILNALRLPTAGLTVSAKKTGGRMYILISATEERLFHEAERIHLSVPLKSEYGGGYDDFDIRKKRFYEPAAPVRGETEAPSFFRRLQRMQLIDSIICSRVEDGGCNLVVPKLLKNGIINKYYGLHDEEERSSLMRHWVWRNIIKTQDIDRVRNYFGEEIAFYFAWLEFKTSRLTAAMALGLVVTALWIAGKLTDNGDLEVWPLTLYSVYLGVWAALFQNYWARRESTLAFKWGVTELEDVETLRPEYFGDDKEGLYFNGEWIEFGGEETDKISAALTEIITGENPNKTNEEAEKQTGGTRPMAVKLNVERQPYYSAIKRNLKILLSLPILGVIVLVMVITTIAVLTLRLFLQRAIGKIDDRLTIIGSIVGGIANAVCIILLNQVYQRLALRLTLWENYRTYSQFNNQLTVKMFFFQFVNSYLSLYYLAFFKNGTRLWGSDDPDVWDTCKQGSDSPNIIGWGCIDEVSTQIGTLMITAMTIGNIKQVVLPWLLGMIRAKLYARKQVEEKTLQQYEKESNLQDWPGVFDEYNEMAIQYGFITLFAAAFPLAPLLGWVNCAIQLRSDAFKLLEAFGKPHFRTAAGIGTWRMIFEFVGVAAIITNCALICFAYPTLLSAIQRSMGVSPSADLAWRAAFATFGICVILEHVLILSKYLIDVLIPDVPGSVRKAMAKAEYLKEETFKTLNPEKISSDWKAKTIKNGTNEEQLSNETF